MPLNVFTGPRCRFTLNGTVVALGRSVSASEEWTWDPLNVLDNIEDLDHIPVGYRCSMQAAEIMLVGQTLEALGFAPRKGQTPQEHLRNILTMDDMVAQLEDSQSDIVVARVFGVRLATKQFAVDPRGIVARDLSFVARRVVEAAET